MSESFYGVIPTRNIKLVQLGDLEFDTWYGNPLYFGNDCKTLGYKYAKLDPKFKKVVRKQPTEFWLEKLFVCEHCFKYTDEKHAMAKHRTLCRYATRFPGKIKYMDSEFQIRKVKGCRHQLYCQNLCLFAKLFLDTKSIFFNVENFDFYVVYGRNDNAISDSLVPMGYFSKEVLQCWDENNLGCICVFPPYQHKKLGTLLINFSYELSRFQGLISGPEHPLSTFGRISYINYWCKSICTEFGADGKFAHVSSITIDDISRFTGFRPEDVLSALEYMNAIYKVEQNGATELHIDKSAIVDYGKVNYVDKRSYVL